MNRSRSPFLPTLVLTSGIAITTNCAFGQPPRESVTAGESLVHQRITLSVDEQPLGELLPKLLSAARQHKLSDHSDLRSIRSLWLDRHVDRNAKVSLSEASTPAAQVILKVAEMNGLAVFPLPGALVVGRPAWVDSAISHLPPSNEANEDFISVRWPTGSTAAEILALILAAPSHGPPSTRITDLADMVPRVPAENASSQIPSWVPHDIWASGSLIGVDRTLAVGLLLAQFRCALQPGSRLETLAGGRSSTNSNLGPENAAKAPAGVVAWTEMPAEPTFLLSYPAGDSALAVRSALTKTQPRPSIRVSNKQLLINTTALHHRLGIAVHWRTVAATPQAAAAVASDSTSVFDLKLVKKPAAEVIGQLAQAARKKFRIQPGAEQVGEKLVTLDAKKLTLEQLAQLVAEATGGHVQWNEAEVVLSTR